jgi:hypothetical protein
MRVAISLRVAAAGLDRLRSGTESPDERRERALGGLADQR